MNRLSYVVFALILVVMGLFRMETGQIPYGFGADYFQLAMLIFIYRIVAQTRDQQAGK